MVRLALLVHLLAVVFWVGGMAFAHVALRPALSEIAEPPRRLALLVAVLSRFFLGVSLAVVLILATGAYLLLAGGGLGVAPAAVHTMTALGLAMALVYAYVRLRSYPALRAAVAAQTWPAAGIAAATIRRLVALNLVLGTIVIVIVVLGR